MNRPIYAPPDRYGTRKLERETETHCKFVRETADALPTDVLTANAATARRIADMWAHLADDLDQVLAERGAT